MDGPGQYVADSTEGITHVEDLPPPRIESRSRNYPRRRCPNCERPSARRHVARRILHELGDPRSGRPRDLHRDQRAPGRCRALLTLHTERAGAP